MKFAETTSTNFGNLGERQDCKFDDEGTAHIMGILSNMYGNRKRAALQEYAANGADSHKAAGVTAPVRVILPTDMNPNVTIKDQGLGLSKDEVIRYFATYGASTKRQDNNSIGGFGIGSKSAFTIATQFTIEAVKDGEHTIAIFSLDNNKPGFTIVHEGRTEDRNGVTVKIPAKADEYEEWEEEAAKCFSTWKKGTITVNGREPESIFKNAVQMSDTSWVIAEDYRSGYATIIMGGIAYKLDWNLARRIGEGNAQRWAMAESGHYIVEVPMGSIDIRPDREGLRDTTRTIKAIQSAMDDALASIANKFEAELALAETVQDKCRVTAEWNDQFGRFGVRQSYPAEATKIETTIPVVYGGGYGRRAARAHLTINPADTQKDITFIVGAKDVYTKVDRLIGRYRHHHDFPRVAIVMDDTAEIEWWTLDEKYGHKIVKAEDFLNEAKALPAIQRGPRSGGGGGQRQPVLYTVHNGDGNQRMTVEDLIEEEKPVLLATGWRDRDAYTMESITDNYTIVSLSGAQRETALAKRLGDLYDGHVTPILKKALEEEANNITDEDKALIGLRKAMRRNHPYLLDSVLDIAEEGTNAYRLATQVKAAFAEDIVRKMRLLNDKGVSVPESNIAAEEPMFVWIVSEHYTIPENILKELVKSLG